MGLTIAAGLIAVGAALGFAPEVAAGEVTGTGPAPSSWRVLDIGNSAAFWLASDIRMTETAASGASQQVVPMGGTAGWTNGGYVSPTGLPVTLAQMSDSAPQVGDDATVAGLDGPGARLPLRDAPNRDATALARLPNGTPVIVIGEQGQWLRVVTEDGEIGWVRGSYLVPTGATDGAPPAEDLQWTHWINPRFGMSIDYPAALFRPERAPENGDGQSFVTPDGRAGFFVYGQWNTMELGIEEMHEMDIGTGVFGRITENRLSRYDYVLSGQAEDRFTYRRALMPPPGDVLYVFEVSYPAAEEATFGPVLGRMAESFGLASEESGETLPAPGATEVSPPDPVLQILTDELRALLERLP